MNNEKIQHLEEEIKNLFVSNEDGNWKTFWFIHVKPVIEKVKEMAKKYDADEEILWLSAILHDFSQLETIENHDELGAKKGYELLTEKGFSEELSRKVRDVIFTHSASKHIPQTIEQKILATADAMNHFQPMYYYWLVRVNEKPFEETIKKIQEKMERDFNDKIFFEDERNEIEPQYLMLKSWFEKKQ